MKKVIVFINEGNLTDPQVFSNTEAVRLWWIYEGFELDQDYDLMIANLNKGEDFADATSWIGWVEVQ